jgi:hypothetical protein
MGTGQSISEEHALNQKREDQSHIFQVEVVDGLNDYLIDIASDLLAEAFLEINESENKPKVFEVNGTSISIPESEATLYAYLHAMKCKVSVAFNYGETICPAGIIVYNEIEDSIYNIRILYCRPELRGKTVSKRLVDSIAPKVIFFKTRKANNPKDLLGIVKDTKLVREDDFYRYWVMSWET